MLVLPGGGYAGLASHEGEEYAWFLASHGITAAVLEYSVGQRSPGSLHPAPLEDACRAMKILRHHATELKIDPARVAVIGSSAGGHLAATLSTQFSPADPSSPDPVEHHSARPDAAMLCYPVITLEGPHAHVGSRNNLLGEAASAEQIQSMSAHRRVTSQTPPTFLWHTAEDSAVPVEKSLRYATALRGAGVSVELHVFPEGRHGIGLAATNPRASQWPAMMLAWLGRLGW